MPYGADATCLSFTCDKGLRQIDYDTIPDWVRDAMESAVDEGDFARMMSSAGCTCIEQYGAVEALEIWRTSANEPGWLALHFDGDKVDMVFYIDMAAHYAAFQAQWVAPMARKMMDTDRHWMWMREQEQKSEDTPKVH